MGLESEAGAEVEVEVAMRDEDAKPDPDWLTNDACEASVRHQSGINEAPPRHRDGALSDFDRYMSDRPGINHVPLESVLSH